MYPNYLSKKNLLKLLVVIVVISMAWFVYSFSILTINNPSNGDYTVSLDDKRQDLKEGGTFRQIVRRGTHEVMVQQGDSSYFKIISTSSLFRNQSITAELQPEHRREFIGNSPLPCINLSQSTLISYFCDSSLGRVLVHKPATKTVPTYTVGFNSPFEGSVNSIISSKNSAKVFIKPDPGLHVDASHLAFDVNKRHELTKATVIKGLSEGVDYKFKPYREGFVALDPSFQEMLYFRNFSSEPETVDIPAPNNKDLHIYNITAEDDSLIYTYADVMRGSVTANDAEETTSEHVVEVKIIDGDRTVTADFKNYLGEASYCAENTICWFNNNQLDVYRLDGGKAKLLYTVSGVDHFSKLNQKNKIVFSKAEGVIEFDVVERTGLISYGLSSNKLCGLENQPDSYVLCVISNDNQKFALNIDNSSESDNIDKKIAALASSGVIERVSVYKNYIYISPNLKGLTFTPGTSGSGYNPAELKKINNQINDLVNESGIDLRKYTIINPYDN